MSVNEDMFYFLNWELIPSLTDAIDATQGNEFIEIFIQDVVGCRPACRYTLPIVQSGQSFSLLRANLLYPKDKCTKPLKHIFVSIRIYRGLEQQLIYTNDCILSPSHYANGGICRIPIYRVWYLEDYFKFILTNIFP
jgi:hypothetical protein